MGDEGTGVEMKGVLTTCFLLAVAACQVGAKGVTRMDVAKEDVPVPSPGGTYSATVWSNVQGDIGNTQVIIDAPASGTGSGIFTLDLPHVPLKLRWTSDSDLVIAHPREIAPRPGDSLARQERIQFAAPHTTANLNQALQGMDPRDNPEEYLKKLQAAQKDSQPRFVNIKYEQYEGAGEVVAELRRKAESAPPPTPPTNLLDEKLRGGLVAVDDGQFVYDYYDAHKKDAIAPALLKRDYQAGGESWAGIVYGLLKLKAPHVLAQVRMDPEGDGLRVWSSNKAALEKIAELVTAAHGDSMLLNEAIKRAEADRQME